MSPASRKEPAESLAEVLGYTFRDQALLETALSHPSFAHETDGTRGNERLEFLGDAVLDLVIAQRLYRAHPEWPEGDLTRARAALVNQRALAARARELGLGGFVKLGRTERRSAGEEKDSILANCFEALVGALYLDGGLECAEVFLQRVFGLAVERGASALRRDAKTEFQEWAHAHFRITPCYEAVADSGTDNDERRFTVDVRIGSETWGRGVGRSKRSAEQAAAEAALVRGAERDDSG